MKRKNAEQSDKLCSVLFVSNEVYSFHTTANDTLLLIPETQRQNIFSNRYLYFFCLLKKLALYGIIIPNS